MATPGQLISTTAALLGLPENAVVTPWRTLREAGVVTKGARGRNAAHVSPLDAAELLVASVGLVPLKGVIGSWREYSRLRPRSGAGYVTIIRDELDENPPRAVKKTGRWELPLRALLPAVSCLGARHTFSQALAAFIDVAAEAPFALPDSFQLTVKLFGPYPWASITLFGSIGAEEVEYGWGPRRFGPAPEPGDPKFTGDLSQTREFSEATILGLGRLLAVAKQSSDDLGENALR